MAKRTIYECDLTKLEMDPDEAVTISFKKKGKRTASSFELSPEAAEKLLAQLNGKRELPEGWNFSAGDYAPAVDLSPAPTQLTPTERRELLAEGVDDAELHALEQRRERRRAETTVDHDEDFTDSQIVGPATVAPEGDHCPHLNKTRVTLTMRNKKRYAYRTCKSCGVEVPEPTLAEREGLNNVKAPGDSRIEHNSKVRKINS